jgi:hypothetical protein
MPPDRRDNVSRCSRCLAAKLSTGIGRSAAEILDLRRFEALLRSGSLFLLFLLCVHDVEAQPRKGICR